MAPSSVSPPVQPLVAYGCMLLWVMLSAAVIMLNKWILDPRLGGFPFPLTLTASHMVLCSAATIALTGCGAVERPPPVDRGLFLRTVVPIGALFAAALWLGNTAYVYLSVSFVQMLKAVMPLAVYSVGCLIGTESPSLGMALNLLVVVTGVLIATAGEVRFVLAGVLAQAASIASEATRLTLVQVLLQGTDIKLTPLSTMYYVAPVCFAFLLAPLLALEAPKLLQSASAWGRVGPGLLLLSAAAAFALNLSVLLLIGKTSALTLNLAGVLKDWLLIGLSVALYGSAVSPLQLGGYGLSLAGVIAYNLAKFHRKAPHDKGGDKGPGDEGPGGGARDGGGDEEAAAGERRRLLGGEGGGGRAGGGEADELQQQQPEGGGGGGGQGQGVQGKGREED